MTTSEEFLEHYGVKGMKWGVRNNDPSTKKLSARQERYNQVRNREMTNFSVTTKLGEKVDVTQKPAGKLSAYVSSLSKMGTDDALNTYEFSFDVGGKTVGQASMERRSKDELYLNWLGVDSNQRGKGYGSAVFDAAVKHGLDTGAKKITLEVPGKSPDAQHIYEKQGFVVTKAFTKKEAAEDPVWGGLNEMELDLTKRAIKHAIKHALTEEDNEIEEALMSSFATLPKKLEKELFDQTESDMEQSSSTQKTEEFLAHYGKKGMKWGVRKDKDSASSGGPGSSKPKLSRKEVRKINKAGELDYNVKKLEEVYAESKAKGGSVLVKSRVAGDYADTVMTGREFVNHVERGGLVDGKSTRIFARQEKEGEAFVMNNFQDEKYIPIKRK